MNSPNVKTDTRRPAYVAVLASEASLVPDVDEVENDSTMEYIYGKILVHAIASLSGKRPKVII